MQALVYMITNITFNFKKGLSIGLVSLISLYANPIMARTLIFQSGSEPSTSQQAQSGQDRQTNKVEQLLTSNTTVNATSTSSANSELFFMIEQLQSEINTLRGMLEEQSHE